MTPAPQKEYIITEKQLKDMVENGTVGYSPYRDGVADVVRSRPYIPTTSAELELKLFDEILEWGEKFGDNAIIGYVKARKHGLERKLRAEARQ